ncbi:GNAT family N-acetyltransferase [Marinicella sp. W31]|uniref:GNAT family N-acetyltransferase n=1 Tax=Marinicella sp. W31 TaxID=3023713 RepID=UPI003757176F
MSGFDPISCRLIQATFADLEMLKSWFKQQYEVDEWGGPHMRFPFQQSQFLKDIRFADLQSYSLFYGEQMVAFGQCYDRLGHCHLGRLIVHPQQRRKGFGVHLIEQLTQIGCQKLNTHSVSLFVLKKNHPAKKLYIKLGFVEQIYPGDDLDMDINEIAYLIKTQ